MNDLWQAATPRAFSMSRVATLVGLLALLIAVVIALLFALAPFVARWLDRRHKLREFLTEGGRHDWREPPEQQG